MYQKLLPKSVIISVTQIKNKFNVTFFWPFLDKEISQKKQQALWPWSVFNI